METKINNYNGNEIAVIGMSGRFPKANSIEELWERLKNGDECITHYDDQTLVRSGIDESLLRQKNYIKAKGELTDMELFDASFFNINPKDAELMDPQHRMMLECAWHTFENAGYNPLKIKESVGVFTGKSMSSYLFLNIYPHMKKVLAGGNLQAAIGNDKDSIPTTISYHLDLKGPSMAVQSSSSTSLTAISVACQSLLTFQCDMALAGGITAGPPINSGYIYDVGGIMSKDGHNKSFDKDSSGFVPGSGYGQVLLKRLEDAINDGDFIWGIIKGFTINNDGYHKISYTAPSSTAQTELVMEAQAVAGIHPEQLGYIEAHGTGTRLGDPIELKGLTKAFRYKTDKKNYCAVGSIKSNIGHLDSAAGVAGFIKTVLALHHKQIPPSINYTSPNPEMDIENSPFFINTKLRNWKAVDGERFAGVTSLGMGGTNAHVILQDYCNEEKVSEETSGQKIVLLSAKTQNSLKRNTENLLKFLKNTDEYPLDDIAYTYAVGREQFVYRYAITCQTKKEAIKKLENIVSTGGNIMNPSTEKPAVFVFDPYTNQDMSLGKQLYETESVYRNAFDQCANIVQPMIKKDITSYYEDHSCKNKEISVLNDYRISQIFLFSYQYAKAKLLMSKGVRPSGVLGYGAGEYVAGIVSGVFSLEEGLRLVVAGLRYTRPLENHAMLAVYCSERRVRELINESCRIVAVNSPTCTIIQGKPDAIKKFRAILENNTIQTDIVTEGYFIPEDLQADAITSLQTTLEDIELSIPKIPFVSTIKGDVPSNEEVKSISFWKKSIEEPVALSKAISGIMSKDDYAFIEIGSKNALKLYIKEIGKKHAYDTIVFSENIPESHNKQQTLHDQLALQWVNGVTIDWETFYASQSRKRVPLPTYAFDHKRYWIPSENEKAVGVCGSSQITEDILETSESLKDNRPKLSNEYEAPKTEIAITITKIWEDLLSIKPIGISDNFFDLNGHSLLATQILSRIGESFNVELPIESIFENQTISELSELVEKENSKNTNSDDFAKLLKEIDGLSLEEIKQSLNQN